MDKPEPVFIDGYITRDVLNTEPEWILGKGAIHADKMIAWLQLNKKYADKGGWIPYQTLRSKEKQTRYSLVDMYQVNKSIEGTKTTHEDANPKYAPRTDKQFIENEISKKLYGGSELTAEDYEAMNEIPF